MNKKTTIIVLSLIFVLAFAVSCAPPDTPQPEGSKPTESAQQTESAPDIKDSARDKDEFSVSLIGDSVPLGAVAQIKEELPGIEMLLRPDRDLAGAGMELLKEEVASGKIGDIVVLALGTSNLSKKDIDEAVSIIGADRKIVFVTAYRGGASYIEKVNEAIAAAASEYENLSLADWYAYVKSHPELKLAEDDCHLTDESAGDYAQLIKSGVEEAKDD